MPPRVPPSRIAQALEYLQGLKSGVGEFVGGVGSNLADRARAAGGLAYEALTSDPNIGRMTTAEFSQAAADRAPTPRLNQAARDIGTIGRAIVTQPVETGKAIVRGEVERAQQAMTSPQAAGQYAGSLIDPTRLAAALRHRIPISELDVYHGTPHKYAPTEANPLGEFDASKIGTGEGAQAYGHGIYLAESPGVATAYKTALEAGKGVDDADVIARLLKATGGSATEAAAEFRRRAQRADTPEGKQRMLALAAKTEGGFDPRGSLYKADLPDEMIDRMLDWDKPLSEQSAAVREALMKNPAVAAEVKRINAQREALNAQDPRRLTHPVISKLAKKETTAELLKGQALYELLAKGGNQAETSAYLRSLGIPGIRYLDAGSRDGGSGTRNFVVFPGEEKKVRILERNGQPAPERIAQALEAAPTAARLPTALPTVKPGDVIDGYKVRPDIPNQSSIAASLDNYEVLPGIRSISMTEFDPQYVRSISPDKLDSRTRKLMDEISQSKELNPLIVAYDSKGPYIIEGGHRFDALAASKAKSVPAMVVIDMDDPPR
jgi:hypothetical protein